MKEYFRLKQIDLGFASHPTEGTIYSPGALQSEVLIRRGKLRINLLTPGFTLTPEIHNGLLADPQNNSPHIPYLRFTTYFDLAIPDGQYDTKIMCPINQEHTGFEVYGFPGQVGFRGTIDLQKEFVHITGVLHHIGRNTTNPATISVDILKKFDPKPLIPKRIIYTLNNARTAPPLSVYELSVGSGTFTDFPDEILNYKNLEKISFRNNQLTSLPPDIGNWPALKELNIEDNKFERLPDNLTNIPILSVDRKNKKLFMDNSYKTKNPAPIDHTLFDLSQYPTEKENLKTTIQAIPELKDFQDLLLEYSTMATYLILQEEKDIPLGKSKVGGAPDLPPALNYPTDKNGLHYLFHAQLNCADLAPFQSYLPRKGILYFFVNDEEFAQKAIVLFAEAPQNLTRVEYGMDTRFIDGDYENNIRDAIAVGFANAINLPELYNSVNHGTERYPRFAHLWEWVEEEEMKWQELDAAEEAVMHLSEKIEKPAAFDNGFIKTDSHSLNSSVFTQHESPQEQAAARFGGEPGDWMVLLCLESVGEFNFWDAGTLTYCIHKKDLAIADFSRIHASIESS